MLLSSRICGYFEAVENGVSEVVRVELEGLMHCRKKVITSSIHSRKAMHEGEQPD